MKILITGASEGIGRSIAIQLSKSNHDLILVARDQNKLYEVKQECLQIGAKSVEVHSVDLRDITQINKFADTSSLKNLDGLINNAGIWQKKAQLDEIPEEEILNVINTNLIGLIALSRKLLPIIRKSKDGFIINISSRSGYSASQGQAVYSASKYGVRGFTEVLREDLIESGVRVAGIYQGGTNTQMFNKAGEEFPTEKLATFIPPDEIAKVIAFLIERPKGIWLPEIRIEKA